jgi:hypothetical protein
LYTVTSLRLKQREKVTCYTRAGFLDEGRLLCESSNLTWDRLDDGSA